MPSASASRQLQTARENDLRRNRRATGKAFTHYCVFKYQQNASECKPLRLLLLPIPRGGDSSSKVKFREELPDSDRHRHSVPAWGKSRNNQEYRGPPPHKFLLLF